MTHYCNSDDVETFFMLIMSVGSVINFSLEIFITIINDFFFFFYSLKIVVINLRETILLFVILN